MLFVQDGTTSLKTATQKGHLDVIKLLLDRGANIDPVDRVSYNFEMIWVRQGFTGLCLLFSFSFD